MICGFFNMFFFDHIYSRSTHFIKHISQDTIRWPRARFFCWLPTSLLTTSYQEVSPIATKELEQTNHKSISTERTVKRFSKSVRRTPRTNEHKKSVYIYDIYDIHNQSIQKFLEATRTDIKISRCIKVSPTAWLAFKEWLRRTEPNSSMSENINEHIIRYVVAAKENRHQPKITQFFINKPEQVNIAEKQVIVQKKKRKRLDYSKMSLEDLERELDYAKKLGNHAQIQTLAFFVKKKLGVTNAR